MAERIDSGRSYLAGTLTAPVHLLATANSLKLIRPLDALSPQIRSAMAAGSPLFVVEIDTPGSKVTLLDARIVNIIHPVFHITPKGGTSHRTYGPVNWRLGGSSGKNHNPFDLIEIELTFQKIIYNSKSGRKGLTDDWSSGG